MRTRLAHGSWAKQQITMEHVLGFCFGAHGCMDFRKTRKVSIDLLFFSFLVASLPRRRAWCAHFFFLDRQIRNGNPSVSNLPGPFSPVCLTTEILKLRQHITQHQSINPSRLGACHGPGVTGQTPFFFFFFLSVEGMSFQIKL